MDGQPGTNLLGELRRVAGLTQEELAEHTGLTVRGISNIERGRVAQPRRRSLEALARGLGLRNDQIPGFVRHYLPDADPAPRPAIAPPPASVPAQLPSGSTSFTGRRDELTTLDGLAAAAIGPWSSPCSKAWAGWARRRWPSTGHSRSARNSRTVSCSRTCAATARAHRPTRRRCCIRSCARSASRARTCLALRIVGERLAHNGLGDNARATGDRAAALAHYLRARDVAQLTSEQHEEARALDGIAATYEDAGETEKARPYRHRARALYDAMGISG